MPSPARTTQNACWAAISKSRWSAFLQPLSVPYRIGVQGCQKGCSKEGLWEEYPGKEHVTLLCELHLCVCHLSLPSGWGWGPGRHTIPALWLRAFPWGRVPIPCAMTAEWLGTDLNAFPRQVAWWHLAGPLPCKHLAPLISTVFP
jgi:hypothetical protein